MIILLKRFPAVCSPQQKICTTLNIGAVVNLKSKIAKVKYADDIFNVNSEPNFEFLKVVVGR